MRKHIISKKQSWDEGPRVMTLRIHSSQPWKTVGYIQEAYLLVTAFPEWSLPKGLHTGLEMTQ